eukprot:m.82050 g.82050  ORF g.82050 m.82050 type:complete len:135 (+) comp25481_c0_seq1:1396-1800(+)
MYSRDHRAHESLVEHLLATIHTSEIHKAHSTTGLRDRTRAFHAAWKAIEDFGKFSVVVHHQQSSCFRRLDLGHLPKKASKLDVETTSLHRVQKKNQNQNAQTQLWETGRPHNCEIKKKTKTDYKKTKTSFHFFN